MLSVWQHFPAYYRSLTRSKIFNRPSGPSLICIFLAIYDYIDYRKSHVSSCDRILNSFYSKAFQSRKRLLIVQCSAGRKYNHLISYARYRVPLLQETETNLKESSSYVVFVIHLPRHHIDTSVFGLQGGQWLSAHIDDLRESNIAPYVAMGKRISDLLCDLKSGESLSSSLLYQQLHSCIQTAASRLHKSEEQPSTRSVQRINILLDLIPKSSAQSGGKCMCASIYVPLR